MKTAVIIPARYASSRYPGKPLVPLLGKPMVIWVAERAMAAVGRENVYIATEDDRISDVVRASGFQALMTSSSALTGTDRVAEAAGKVQADCYINLQGDEPLVNPQDILHIVETKQQHPDLIINAYTWVGQEEDPKSVNIPKVITNESGLMVYMSRQCIPGFKDTAMAPDKIMKQVCIYAFSKDELDAYRAFGRKGRLEATEDIEILRFLELNRKVLMVEATPGSLAVDVPSDVEPVERELERLNA